MHHLSASSTVFLLGDNHPREQGLEYLVGPRAQVMARIKGIREYRQHHFDLNSKGLWPVLAGVDTTVDESDDRIDGMEEFLLKDAVSFKQKQMKANESHVFKETDHYIASETDNHWLRSPNGSNKVGFRTIVLIRRKADIALSDFEDFIKNILGPALANTKELFEVRYQVLLPATTETKSKGNYHALFVLGAFGYNELQQSLLSPVLAVTWNAQSRYCDAIHAYSVSQTYVFTKEGRPTLPQVKPEPKPSLEPVKRELPPAPARASLKKGNTPFPPSRLIPINGYGPEDVVVDDQGRLLCGVKGGRILRIDPERGIEEMVGNTGGRPLGLEVLPDGRLLICDAYKGLLRLDTDTGKLETLVQYVDNLPLRFCSNATAASDGTIWFTESTNRYDFEQYKGALYEHRPSGRLFRRDPDGRVEVILDKLHFANGVTMSSDQSAVLFVETDGYRLNRLWIRGPHADKREILAENLPGFPDNVSRIQDGKFWVAMVTPRNKLLDSLGKAPALFRKLIWRIPDQWQPAGVRTTWAMLFDENGNVLMDLQDTLSNYHGVTGVAEYDGRLYLAGLEEKALLSLDLRGYDNY
ncbi:sugar lactone lactonase YvrE [Neobacillus niacini]|uniref:SMP-30/gluconolactonase/LRE family protein n=1 Tax=Neobacillus niacini TaxID=86668 RepID=UPI0028544E73|nr:SMP-30/gluconolactonase/LRE family protein [Neobacillus niacini]MDR7075993.1 sugar lactone lactonase YvrE [Neobacillus niacini]